MSKILTASDITMEYGCVIVFGKPGCGKTAFLTAVAVNYLNNSNDCLELMENCKNSVQNLINEGYDYGLPEQVPVYSNYKITVPLGNNIVVEPYYLDGYHFGFENPDVPVMPVYPYSRIFFTEAQRYYNSRRFGALPDWVSRAFEQCRHNWLFIMIDTQRPILIDANIRDISFEYIEVEKVEQVYNKHGFVVATDFTLKVFYDFKYVEAYLAGTSEHYERKVVRFDFNVFDYYVSQVYYKNFLPKVEFSRVRHAVLSNKVDDTELAKAMYSQTAPQGFYKKK